MTQNTIASGAGISRVSSATTTRETKALLAGGTVAGPLFIVIALIQVLIRSGFDPRRHPLSLLSLGDPSG